MGRVPRQGQDWGGTPVQRMGTPIQRWYPFPTRDGVPLVRQGYLPLPTARDGYTPQDRTAGQAHAKRHAVCLLRSHRRTVLLLMYCHFYSSLVPDCNVSYTWTPPTGWNGSNLVVYRSFDNLECITLIEGTQQANYAFIAGKVTPNIYVSAKHFVDKKCSLYIQNHFHAIILLATNSFFTIALICVQILSKL